MKLISEVRGRMSDFGNFRVYVTETTRITAVPQSRIAEWKIHV